MGQDRKKELGAFGEDRAFRLLRDRGFTIEKTPKNCPLFDLMAKRDGHLFLFTVKTRNNVRADGRIKTDPYNLYDEKKGHYDEVRRVANFLGARIYWVAVTVDAKAKTYGAYWGNVSWLQSPKQIPMHPTRNVPKHDSLVTDAFDEEISESWSNVVGTVGR